MKRLDLITIGRASVDLYGAQVGGRLEDMGSFQKYIGGSPCNMAAGTARLGLRLKKLGNSIQEVIGGRAIHPVNAASSNPPSRASILTTSQMLIPLHAG